MNKEAILRCYADGQTPMEISKQFGINYNTVKSTIYRNKNRAYNPEMASMRYEATGDVYTYTKQGQYNEDEPITAQTIMRMYNLDENIWDIVSFTNNTWQGQGKDGEIVDLYQCKLTVRPKKQNELTFSDIDEFLNNKTFKHIEPIVAQRGNLTGKTLEIDIADLHCGLLSWRNETNNDYDLKICADQFLEQIWEIVKKAKGQQFKDIYICSLGDIIHVDNDNNTTTKGTIQQVDGRIAKIFDYAFDIMNTVIDWLRPLGARLHYVYLCGNHDRNVGYYLAKCLQLANKDVDFDITPKPQKAICFGSNLIGLSHGDMPKKNKAIWLLIDYREQFGKSKFVEEHCGHIHCEEAKQYNGIVVRSVLAPTGASYWENQQGYRSKRGIQSFVYDDEQGLQEIWFNFIPDNK